MKKYNLSKIMKRAWDLVKKAGMSISSGLKKAWMEAKTNMDLEGSEKQINWAKDIIDDARKAIDNAISFYADDDPEGYVEEVKAAKTIKENFEKFVESTKLAAEIIKVRWAFKGEYIIDAILDYTDGDDPEHLGDKVLDPVAYWKVYYKFSPCKD